MDSPGAAIGAAASQDGTDSAVERHEATNVAVTAAHPVNTEGAVDAAAAPRDDTIAAGPPRNAAATAAGPPEDTAANSAVRKGSDQPPVQDTQVAPAKKRKVMISYEVADGRKWKRHNHMTKGEMKKLRIAVNYEEKSRASHPEKHPDLVQREIEFIQHQASRFPHILAKEMRILVEEIRRASKAEGMKPSPSTQQKTLADQLRSVQQQLTSTQAALEKATREAAELQELQRKDKDLHEELLKLQQHLQASTDKARDDQEQIKHLLDDKKALEDKARTYADKICALEAQFKTMEVDLATAKSATTQACDEKRVLEEQVAKVRQESAHARERAATWDNKQEQLLAQAVRERDTLSRQLAVLQEEKAQQASQHASDLQRLLLENSSFKRQLATQEPPSEELYRLRRSEYVMDIATRIENKLKDVHMALHVAAFESSRDRAILYYGGHLAVPKESNRNLIKIAVKMKKAIALNTRDVSDLQTALLEWLDMRNEVVHNLGHRYVNSRKFDANRVRLV